MLPPSWAIALLIARPMPRPPPVITMVLSFRLRRSVILREAAGSFLRGVVEVKGRRIVCCALMGDNSLADAVAVALRVVGLVSENMLATSRQSMRCLSLRSGKSGICSVVVGSLR